MNSTATRPRLQHAIQRVRECLEQARSQYQVDVFAFYIGNDPFLPAFLRCLAAPGADYEEATAHFRHKPFEFPHDRNSGFIADTAKNDSLRDGPGEVASRLIKRDRERNLVFGDFVERERIKSRAWFAHRDTMDGPPEALLTVNYRQPREEDAWRRRDQEPLQKFFDSLIRHLEEIEILLKEMYTSLAWNLIGIINLALPAELGKRPGASCPPMLKEILQRATEALSHLSSDTPPDKWCATMYLLDVSRRRLRLTAQARRVQLPQHELDVEAGEGVVSWVAIRGQALRILDFDKAPKFKAIHRDFQLGIRGQFAVPMIRDGLVIGVLSLESPEAGDAFPLTSVGFLTRVASLLAVQLDFEQVRAERDLYLDAVYAFKKLEIPVEPLPTFEDLVRTSAKPLQSYS